MKKFLTMLILTLFLSACGESQPLVADENANELMALQAQIQQLQDQLSEMEILENMPILAKVEEASPTSSHEQISNISIEYELTHQQEIFFEHRAEEFTYRGLFQFTNTGSIPIYFGRSRFDLIDENNRILSANNTFNSSPQILHPGERGYLWASERIVGASADTEVTIVPRWDFSRSLNDRPNLELTDIEVRDNPNRFIDDLMVFGRITNNTNSEVERADITVILYTYDGTPLGVWDTVVRNLPAGGSFGFETSWGNSIMEDLTAEMVVELTAFAVDFFQRNR